MNIRALRTLVEIDRVGSFATVADRLGMTLSAVSVQMKTLEEELQVALFDRRHRPPAMTPAARQVAAHARTILGEVEALRAVGGGEGGLAGRFRIGVVGTASVRLLPAFLVAAAERFPDAQFEVESGVSADLLARVQAARLDAAVITETPDLPRALRFEPLAREAFALAAPAGAAGQGLRACAGTLAYVRFQPSTGIGLIVDTYLQRLDCAVSETVTLDSVEAVMGCVEAGLGFAVVPEPDARRYARRAHVSRLADPPLERHVVLAGRPAGEAGVDIAPLADLLRAALGNSQS